MALQDPGYDLPGKEARWKGGIVVFATRMSFDEVVHNEGLGLAIEGAAFPAASEVDSKVLHREVRTLEGFVSLELLGCKSWMLGRQLIQVFEPE